jgi:steroid delta-isomerase-like uncharacterized protein
MSIEQNLATVRSIYEGFNTRNIPQVLATVTEDFELVDMALGRTWRGVQGWGEWLQLWAMAMPDASVRLDTIVADGDLVVTEHTGGGTQTGMLDIPSGAIAPTGRRLELKYAEVFEMRGGKIKALRAYYDGAALLRQLGKL